MSFWSFLGLLVIILISAACHLVMRKFFRVEKRINDAVENRIFRRTSKETDVDQTFAADADMNNLPAHMDFIAGFGKEKTAPDTLGVKILRPTLGLRFISFLLGAALLWMAWLGPAQYLGSSLWMKLGVTAVIAYATIYTNLYELRYDASEFVHRNFVFMETTYSWNGLRSIKDNGHYEYVLRMDNGAKVSVQKYLVGISGFVAYAKDRIVQNNMM